MPIYEFYCPDNHRIYQFYARTLAQGRTVPACPDNPTFTMRKVFSSFAVTGARPAREAAGSVPSDTAGEGRREAALGDIEREFSGVDESDPRAMGRMMRRMADLTGEKIGGPMEEMVRKLEEGADPESLEEQLGADADGTPAEGPGAAEGPRHSRRAPRRAPARDPRLYDYP